MALRDFLEKITPSVDSIKHIFLGLILTLDFIPLFWWVALLLNLTLLWAYEYYQKKSGTGVYDLKDLWWGTFPSLIVIIILFLTPWAHNLIYN